MPRSRQIICNSVIIDGCHNGGHAISREWRFRNFARAAELANLAAWQAEAANHHPDIAFGWGFARVTFTTHSAGGVTMNDLIMAARLKRLAD